MAKKAEPVSLPNIRKATPKVPVIGVFATSDPRIDKDSRLRCQNIVKMAAEVISGAVVLPDKMPLPVVYSTVLVDGETQPDIVAQQFRKAGVDILVCVPDTWAFPQLTAISLLQQFPCSTPINITCGNSGRKPGVVYAHARSGAVSQYGKLVSLNVGNWPDTGMNPKMSDKAAN
jgi:L-fucose isomerase